MPVCMFIFYYIIFLRIDSLVFFILCMMLRGHKYSKLMEPKFCGNILACPKVGQKAQNGPNYPLVCYYIILLRIIFIYFALSWGENKYSKLLKRIFLGKFSLARKQAKKAQNGSICVVVCYGSSFFRFVSLVFLYFTWSWGTINTKNWQSQICWKNSCVGENAPKWPNLFFCQLL